MEFDGAEALALSWLLAKVSDARRSGGGRREAAPTPPRKEVGDPERAPARGYHDSTVKDLKGGTEEAWETTT